MFAFSDVLDFFTYELAGLGRGSFPFALFAPRSSNGFLFGHGALRVVLLILLLQSGFHSGAAPRNCLRSHWKRDQDAVQRTWTMFPVYDGLSRPGGVQSSDIRTG